MFSYIPLFMTVVPSTLAFLQGRLCGPVEPKKIYLKLNAASDHAKATSDSVIRRHLIQSLLATGVISNSLTSATAVEKVDQLRRDPDSEWEDIGEIMKPPLDDRDYLAFKMKNGIRVILCSDSASGSMKAGAAVDVHVGASSDPDGIPGLAHFNEHMLFLGTKDYPKEDSFEGFLAANGGSSNAYTASEDTCYYFTIQTDSDRKVEEGLQRFGSFFTSPLFTESATGRELNAIESENAKNLQSDNFRLYQIEKSRQNTNHPHSKFFTGNRKTLLDDSNDAGLHLRKELINFYERYYCSNQMTVAVIGPQPIKELKRMVENGFGKVPSRNVNAPEDKWKGTVPPFGGESIIPSFYNIVQVVPVQDLRQITISWPIIYANEQDRNEALLTKQGNYVGHLVGHEGPGSLLSYLKGRGWANSLSAAGNIELSDFESFEVTIGITKKGLENVDHIIEGLFAYLNMIKYERLSPYIYNEVLQLEELQWRFATKGSVDSYVQSLATSLQIYPPSLCVAGPRRLALAIDPMTLERDSGPRTAFSPTQFAYTRKLTEEFASKLTVDNALITVISKSFKGKTDRTERWYGTEYAVQQIEDTTISCWKDPVKPRKLGLELPRPNFFIPTEEGLRLKFSAVAPRRERILTFEEKVKPVPPPMIIRDDGENGKWTVYYKPDNRFGQPKAYVIFQLLTKEVSSSAKKAALADLYEFSVTDKIAEYAYDAGLAGLTYDLRITPRGVRLTFGGYNDKLQEFVAYISNKLAKDLKDVLPTDESEFERFKDLLSRSLAAFDAKQPYAKCTSYTQLILTPKRFQYSNAEMRDALDQVTLQDLREYAKKLWFSGKGIALLQGNIDKNEAETLVATIDETFGFDPIGADQLPSDLMPLPLPPTRANVQPTKLLLSEPNKENGNAASYVVLQNLSEDPKEHVLIEILGSVLAERFYEDLRTKQQLGYIVSSGIRAIGKTRYIGFIVQSSVVTSNTITDAIIEFLDSAKGKHLKSLSKGDFAVYIKSLVEAKSEPDKQLATEVTRNWAEISSNRLSFDRRQQEIAAALDLSKEDLIEFWDNLYVNDGRRVLISEIVPQTGVSSSATPSKSFEYSSAKAASTGNSSILGIDDINDFRLGLENALL